MTDRDRCGDVGRQGQGRFAGGWSGVRIVWIGIRAGYFGSPLGIGGIFALLVSGLGLSCGGIGLVYGLNICQHTHYKEERDGSCVRRQRGVYGDYRIGDVYVRRSGRVEFGLEIGVVQRLDGSSIVSLVGRVVAIYLSLFHRGKTLRHG